LLLKSYFGRGRRSTARCVKKNKYDERLRPGIFEERSILLRWPNSNFGHFNSSSLSSSALEISRRIHRIALCTEIRSSGGHPMQLADASTNAKTAFPSPQTNRGSLKHTRSSRRGEEESAVVDIAAAAAASNPKDSLAESSRSFIESCSSSAQHLTPLKKNMAEAAAAPVLPATAFLMSLKNNVNVSASCVAGEMMIIMHGWLLIASYGMPDGWILLHQKGGGGVSRSTPPPEPEA
jgi:hypothetical protein